MKDRGKSFDRFAAFGLAIALSSCGGPPPTHTTAQGVLPSAPEMVPAARLAQYKAALPPVAWRRLREIFDSPATIWFDKQVMIPSYQDSVGDGSYTPIGARPNSGGKAIIVQPGKRLFDAAGTHWSFPFGHTAGIDRTPNAEVLNFMALPHDESGTYFPVVYETFDDNRARGGLGFHKWTWWFPKGTVMGEVIFLTNSAGERYAVEVRTRTRYLEGWAVNAFRPFPTAGRLVNAIQRLRPDWMSQPRLQSLIAHLEDPSTLAPRSLTSPAFNQVFVQDGFVEVLPEFGDEALVEELLTQTPFVSAYGHAFATDGAAATYAATTNERFSVVPSDNDVGLLEVNEASCGRCHEDAGRPIEDFESQAILYGDIWGEDRIFSFHPWDQDRYRIFNNENRQVRPLFSQAGIVERYDSARHDRELYQKLPTRY